MSVVWSSLQQPGQEWVPLTDPGVDEGFPMTEGFGQDVCANWAGSHLQV